MARWTLDDIPWHQFDAGRVDPAVLELLKAVMMAERNGCQYGALMQELYEGDPEFQAEATNWAEEEHQHGRALARWAKLADPSFDFEASYNRFARGYWLALADKTLRRSRAVDLMARCIVEVGTSTTYTAIRESTDEPVLKELARRIALDEVHHYNLFYRNMQRYGRQEGFPLWRRLLVAVIRMLQVGDDEMAYAYFAANEPTGSYDRKRYSRQLTRRAYALYRLHHIQHAMRMVCHAIGVSTTGKVQDAIGRAGFRLMQRRAQRLAAAGY